ncbi:hypothetical protein ACE1AT_17400 [Pelatocladus sp. BLCC-F211]|uniref:hypothetical protein n=1 Tax=Pelatocladus sp. BLCC-F211 TaxID=3342752 RepID=UPI0035BB60DC
MITLLQPPAQKKYVKKATNGSDRLFNKFGVVIPIGVRSLLQIEANQGDRTLGVFYQ